MTKKLPKLPYGQGTFSWDNTKIKFQKNYKCEADGKTYRLAVRGTSVNECYTLMRTKEREKERAVITKVQDAVDAPTALLATAMQQWLEETKSRTRKATAYDRNEVTLQQQIVGYQIGKTQIRFIQSKDIVSHLRYLYYEAPRPNGKHGYSYSTVKKTYDLLNQFFSFYYAKDLNNNPMNLVPVPEKKQDVGEISLDDAHDVVMADIVLSDEEISRFKQFVLQEPLAGSVGRSKHGVALFFIMMTCLRVGEAVTVTWGDIDLAKKMMRINKTTSRVKNRTGNSSGKTRLIITKPKTANAVRNVTLSDEVIEALTVIKGRSKYVKPNDFVLATDTGARITETQLYNTLKGVLKGAKLSNPARDKVFGVHYLRHTGISYYLRHGIPVELVSKMAGHSGVDITLRTYYHVINDQNVKLLEMINGIVK